MKPVTVISVQYLRAVAALMVVFHHAREQFPGFQAVFPTTAGQAGVDLFFVISGFIMVVVSTTKPRTGAEFFEMRVVRIVPIYWFYTFMTAGLLLTLPMFFRLNEFTVPHFLLSLLFVPHVAPGTVDSLSPMLKLGWSLNFEMFFYAVFALAIWLSPMHRVLLTAVTLALVVTIGRIYNFGSSVLLFYSDTMVLEFVFGMLIGTLYTGCKLPELRSIPAILLIAVGFGAIFVGGPFMTATLRPLVFGLPAAAIMIGCLSLERRGVVPLLRTPLVVGDASYSIYLVHLLPIVVLRFLLPRLGVATTGVFTTICFVLACLLAGASAGIISYYYIERPLSSGLRNLLAGTSVSRRVA